MKVFKFGGASVKDAEGVKNVAKVLKSEGFENCILIVSAMGKTTNELETVIDKYLKKEHYQAELVVIEEKHQAIAQEIFEKNHLVFSAIKDLFDNVRTFLANNFSTDYNYIYDQVVSTGELVSSKILSLYLNEAGFQNQFLDARKYIKTNQNYREGIVNWEKTKELISTLDKSKSYITQGFIASDEEKNTITLGREGSDYSAAIFAYCLDASALTIWKDVPGVMTGDPRKFKDVHLLSNISYEEAIEMAYYGASVIHPKTLQPLKQKNIPFYVKSFLEPKEPGTKVGASEKNENQETYILKENQNLMRISTRDFAFIAEEHLSQIFGLLAKHKITISLMQTSAISFVLCVEDKYNHIDELNRELQINFNSEVVKNVSLFTVRNAKLEDLNKFYENKNILLEQISKKILQVVTN